MRAQAQLGAVGGLSPAAGAVCKGRAGGGETRAFARLVREGRGREGGWVGVASHWEGSGSALAYDQHSDASCGWRVRESEQPFRTE